MLPAGSDYRVHRYALALTFFGIVLACTLSALGLIDSIFGREQIKDAYGYIRASHGPWEYQCCGRCELVAPASYFCAFQLAANSPPHCVTIWSQIVPADMLTNATAPCWSDQAWPCDSHVSILQDLPDDGEYQKVVRVQNVLSITGAILLLISTTLFCMLLGIWVRR